MEYGGVSYSCWLGAEIRRVGVVTDICAVLGVSDIDSRGRSMCTVILDALNCMMLDLNNSKFLVARLAIRSSRRLLLS